MTARRLLSTALLLLAPALAAVAVLLLRDTVPDPVPTHWNVRGEVDDTADLATYTTVVLVVVTALSVMAGAVTWLTSSRATAAAVTMVGWLAWLFALTYAATLVAADGAADAASVALPWWLVLVVLVGSGLAWLALHALLPPHQERLRRPVPAMALTDDERVVWVGTARSVTLSRLGVVVAVVGAALVLLEPVLGLTLLFTGVLLWWLHTVTVRVDDRGVHAGWGFLRWPGRSIALDRIDAASAETIEPMQWGGWGYRTSARGTAIVVRRGEGIVLHRTGGGDLAITVDGAADAAALVNALVQRATASR